MANIASLSDVQSPSGRGREALALLLTESPLLRALDRTSAWEQDAFNYDWQPALAGTSLKTRAVGNNFTADLITPPSKVAGVQAIHGGAIKIDIARLADAKLGLRSFDMWMQKQLIRQIRQFAKDWENIFFNGDPDANPAQMKGLAKILNGTTDLPGYSGSAAQRVLDAASLVSSAVSLDLKAGTAANNKKFIEALRIAVTQVEGASMICMNRSAFARIETILHESRSIQTTVDNYGNPIKSFDGVPFEVVGDTAIALTEPDNTPTTPLNNTTSIYVLAPGEQQFSLVTNSGFYWRDYDHQEAEEKNLEKFEIRSQLKIETPERVYRIKNLKI